MRNLYYLDADVTDLQSMGHQVIAHVCTESGVWSGGKSTAIARKWPQTRRAYRQWYLDRIKNDFTMGAVQFVNANHPQSDGIVRVANMIAQPDVKRPVQYRALRRCLMTVGRKAIQIGASVHLPILKDDQTDSWPDIELIIYNTLCTAHISVYIYDPQPSRDEQWFGAVIGRTPRRSELHFHRGEC